MSIYMSTPYQPPADSFGIASNCDPATVDYFIKIYGPREAIELSNIDDPTKNTIDVEKIQVALNDAARLIDNYIESSAPQGKLLIAGSYRRTQAILARCYLDTLRTRQTVLDACEKALQQLELWSSKAQPTAALRYQEAQRYWGNKTGFVRASYQRGRAFTEASMLPWQALMGSNNRQNNRIAVEAPQTDRDFVAGNQINIDPNSLPQVDPSVHELNELVSALEETRGVGNFADTQDVGDGNIQDSSLLVGQDETGEFDSESAALLLGEEY